MKGVRPASDLRHGSVSDALRALIDTPSITQGLRRSEDLGHAAALSPDPAATARLLDRAIVDGLDQGDALTALGAIHAIGRASAGRGVFASLGRPSPTGSRSCSAEKAFGALSRAFLGLL